MVDNVDKFLELYNSFDDCLRVYFKDLSRNYSAIGRYIVKLRNSANEDNIKKGDMLDQIRVLRNTLVHEFDMNSKNLLTITDDVLDFLVKEIETFKHPITAYKICTKTDVLVKAKLDDNLRDVLRVMIQAGYTQVPILNDDDSLFGAFSPNTIFQYVGKNERDVNGNMLIKEFINFIPLENHISECYAFIRSDDTLNDVIDLFDKFYRNGRKLQAVFVTKTGSRKEPLLGMIVSFDLLKIKQKQR